VKLLAKWSKDIYVTWVTHVEMRSL